MTPKVLIEGRPGSGKTTLARRLVDRLTQAGVPVMGFTSEEIRESGTRVGFAVEAVDGPRGILAHRDIDSEVRVGKYGVDLATFEEIALEALARAGPSTVAVIDELGKMELASEAFCEEVADLFAGDLAIVATVHVFSHPFTDRLKHTADVETVRLGRANRDLLAEELAERLIPA